MNTTVEVEECDNGYHVRWNCGGCNSRVYMTLGDMLVLLVRIFQNRWTGNIDVAVTPTEAEHETKD